MTAAGLSLIKMYEAFDDSDSDKYFAAERNTLLNSPRACIMFYRVLSTLVAVAVFTPMFFNNVQWSATDQVTRLRTFAQKIAEHFFNDTKEAHDWVDQLEKNVTSAVIQILEKGVNWAMFYKQRGEDTIPEDVKEKMEPVFDYEDEKQDLEKNKETALVGESMMKELRFHKYEETNLCNVKQGIEVSNYDKVVERIAKVVNMPDNLTLLIKEAKDLEDGEVLALDKLSFRGAKGNMVFGKVVVIKRKGKIDLAYSMHGVEYDIKTKQPTEKAQLNAKKLESFEESLKAEEVVKGDKADAHGVAEDPHDYDISFEHRNAFEAFFHRNAIQKFSTHCQKTMKKVFKNDAPVLKVFEVQTEENAEPPQDKQPTATEGR